MDTTPSTPRARVLEAWTRARERLSPELTEAMVAARHEGVEGMRAAMRRARALIVRDALVDVREALGRATHRDRDAFDLARLVCTSLAALDGASVDDAMKKGKVVAGRASIEADAREAARQLYGDELREPAHTCTELPEPAHCASDSRGTRITNGASSQ